MTIQWPDAAGVSDTPPEAWRLCHVQRGRRNVMAGGTMVHAMLALSWTDLTAWPHVSLNTQQGLPNPNVCIARQSTH